MPRSVVAIVIVLAVVGGALAQGSLERKEPEVPFVGTPDPVVMEMLRLAKVAKDDLVYDLGSGDGRIVIAAAKHFGARGVGIELERHLVAESDENARRAGVSDRVRFVHGDIFEADLREATVVTLYLFPAVNARLRPKLLRELRPGTRIVSHMYGIGDWTPHDNTQVVVGKGIHFIYSWIVPPR